MASWPSKEWGATPSTPSAPSKQQVSAIANARVVQRAAAVEHIKKVFAVTT